MRRSQRHDPQEPSSPPPSRRKSAASAPPSPAARVLTQRAVFGTHTTPPLTRRKSSRSAARSSTLKTEATGSDETSTSVTGSVNISSTGNTSTMSENLSSSLNIDTLDESAFKEVISKPGWSSQLTESLQTIPVADLTNGTTDDSMLSNADLSMDVKRKRVRRAPPKISIGVFKSAMASDSSIVNSDFSRPSTRNVYVENLDMSLTAELMAPTTDDSMSSNADLSMDAKRKRVRRAPPKISIRVFQSAMASDSSSVNSDFSKPSTRNVDEENLDVSLPVEPSPVKRLTRKQNEVSMSAFKSMRTSNSPTNNIATKTDTDLDSAVIIRSPPKPVTPTVATPKRKKRVPNRFSVGVFHRALAEDNSDNENDSSILRERPSQVESVSQICAKRPRVLLKRINLSTDSCMSDNESPLSESCNIRKKREAKDIDPNVFFDVQDSENTPSKEPMSIHPSHDHTNLSDVCSPIIESPKARKKRVKDIDVHAFDGVFNTENIVLQSQQSISSQDNSIPSVISPDTKPARKQRTKKIDQHAFDDIFDSEGSMSNSLKSNVGTPENSSSSGSNPVIKPAKKLREKEIDQHDGVLDSDTHPSKRKKSSIDQNDSILSDVNSPVTKPARKQRTKAIDPHAFHGVLDPEESASLSQTSSAGSHNGSATSTPSSPVTRGVRKQRTKAIDPHAFAGILDPKESTPQSQTSSAGSHNGSATSTPSSPVTRGVRKQRTKAIDPHAFHGVLDPQESTPQSQTSSAGSHNGSATSTPSSPTTRGVRKQRTKAIDPHAFAEILDHKESTPLSQTSSAGSHNGSATLTPSSPTTRGVRKQSTKAIDPHASASELDFGKVTSESQEPSVLLPNDSVSSIELSPATRVVRKQRTKAIDQLAFAGILDLEESARQSQTSSAGSHNGSATSTPSSPVTRGVRKQRTKAIDPHAFAGILDPKESTPQSQTPIAGSHNGSATSTPSSPVTRGVRKQRTKAIDPHASASELDPQESTPQSQTPSAGSHNGSATSTPSSPVTRGVQKQRTKAIDPHAFAGILDPKESTPQSQTPIVGSHDGSATSKPSSPATRGVRKQSAQAIDPHAIAGILNLEESAPQDQKSIAGSQNDSATSTPSSPTTSCAFASEFDFEKIISESQKPSVVSPNNSVSSIERSPATKSVRKQSAQAIDPHAIDDVLESEDSEIQNKTSNATLTSKPGEVCNILNETVNRSEASVKAHNSQAVASETSTAEVTEAASSESNTEMVYQQSVTQEENLETVEPINTPESEKSATAGKRSSTRNSRKSLTPIIQRKKKRQSSNASHYKSDTSEAADNLSLETWVEPANTPSVFHAASKDSHADKPDAPLTEHNNSVDASPKKLSCNSQSSPSQHSNEQIADEIKILTCDDIEIQEPTEGDNFDFSQEPIVPSPELITRKTRQAKRVSVSVFRQAVDTEEESPHTEVQNPSICSENTYVSDSEDSVKQLDVGHDTETAGEEMNVEELDENLSLLLDPSNPQMEPRKIRIPKEISIGLFDDLFDPNVDGFYDTEEPASDSEASLILEDRTENNSITKVNGSEFIKSLSQSITTAQPVEELVPAPSAPTQLSNSFSAFAKGGPVRHSVSPQIETLPTEKNVSEKRQRKLNSSKFVNTMNSIAESPESQSQPQQQSEMSFNNQIFAKDSPSIFKSSGKVRHSYMPGSEPQIIEEKETKTPKKDKTKSLITRESLTAFHRHGPVRHSESPSSREATRLSSPVDDYGGALESSLSNKEIPSDVSPQDNQVDATFVTGIQEQTKDATLQPSLVETDIADQSEFLQLSLDIDLEKSISVPRKTRPAKADVSARVFVEALEDDLEVDEIPQASENIDTGNTITADLSSALQFSAAELEEAVNSLVVNTSEVVSVTQEDSEDTTTTTTEAIKKYSVTEFHKALENLETSVTEANLSLKLPERQTRSSSRLRKSSLNRSSQTSVLTLDNDSMSSVSLNISAQPKLTPQTANRTTKSTKSLRRFSFTSQKSYVRKRYTLADLQIAMEAVRSPSLVFDTSVTTDFQSKSMFSIRDLEKAVKTLKADTTIGGDLSQDLSTPNTPQTDKMSKTAPAQVMSESHSGKDKEQPDVPNINHLQAQCANASVEFLQEIIGEFSENLPLTTDKSFEDIEIENNLKNILNEVGEINSNENNVDPYELVDLSGVIESAEVLYENSTSGAAGLLSLLAPEKQQVSEGNDAASKTVLAEASADKTAFSDKAVDGSVNNSKLNHYSNRPDESEINTTVVPATEIMAQKTPEVADASVPQVSEVERSEICTKSTSVVEVLVPDDSDGSGNDSENSKEEKNAESECDADESRLASMVSDKDKKHTESELHADKSQHSVQASDREEKNTESECDADESWVSVEDSRDEEKNAESERDADKSQHSVVASDGEEKNTESERDADKSQHSVEASDGEEKNTESERDADKSQHSVEVSDGEEENTESERDADKSQHSVEVSDGEEENTESERDADESWVSVEDSHDEEKNAESEPGVDESEHSHRQENNKSQHSAEVDILDKTVVTDHTEGVGENVVSEPDKEKEQESSEKGIVSENVMSDEEENVIVNEDEVQHLTEGQVLDEIVTPSQEEDVTENVPESQPALELQENDSGKVDSLKRPEDQEEQSSAESESDEDESQHFHDKSPAHSSYEQHFSGVFSSTSSKKSSKSLFEENENDTRESSTTRRDISRFFQSSKSTTSKTQTVANISGVGDLETRRPRNENMFDDFEQLVENCIAEDSKGKSSKVITKQRQDQRDQLPKRTKRVVNPSLAAARTISGVPYRKPPLKKTKPWVTRRLYDCLHTHFVKKDELAAYNASEDFIEFLVENVTKVIRSKVNSENVIKRIAKALLKEGFVNTQFDFFIFSREYLPESFVAKAFAHPNTKNYLSVRI